jgi:NADPH:quinone reductase
MGDEMRAILCETLAGPGALKMVELPRAALADGQVRIRNHAAGVNFPDLLMTQGKYQHTPAMPFVPGMECAGDIVETRSPHFSIGDRVFAGMKSGAFAEETVIDGGAVFKMPDGMSYEDGATFRVAFKTAYHALVRQGRLQAGEWVLVNGATGGVGMAAVALCKRLGARVIATGGRPEKLAAVKAAGADHVIDLTSQDLRDTALEMTGGKGVEVVYDPVGGDVFVQSLRAARYGARILIIGFASGSIPSVPINRYLIKGLHVMGVRAGESGRRDPSVGDADTRAVLDLAKDGALRPHISVRLPLEQAAHALELMRDRKITGRAALIIRP